MDPLTAWWLAFLAGVYAPLSSPCVLPLYPGFLSFLAGNHGNSGVNRDRPLLALGIVVACGVLISMLAVGVIFTAVVQVSISRFLSVLSPLAFLVLAAFSVMLILDIDLGSYVGGISTPRSGRPVLDAFLLGLFFGVIVLPCNAAAPVALLAIGTTVAGFLESLGSFLAFGIGMSLPLLAFAALTEARSREVFSWLSRHRRAIRFVAGTLMLGISLYYLAFFFFS